MKIFTEQKDDHIVINFEPVFVSLNDELSKINESLVLICAGGYVMQLHGYKATADVDAFYKSNAAIEQIIKKVGDAFGINKSDELWLNRSIANLNPEPPDAYCKPVYAYSNLEVKAVDMIYLIGMKFVSARVQDLRDISTILKHDNNKEPLVLRATLVDMKFDIDISLLLEAFEAAHGMEWLEHFYRENESELIQYF